MEINKIYNMNCLEGLKQLDDNSVDLIVTDPPYGINICSNGKVGGGKLAEVKDYGVQEWDKSIPSEEIFKEMFRVAKNLIIFGGNYMTKYLPPSSCWIVWDKDNTGNFADCELAWTSFNTAVRKFKWRWNGMLQERMNWKENRLHPTQKPIPLFRWILENYSKEGDLILDPFLGSGTTTTACKQLNRKFIGFEISKEYCDIANKMENKNKVHFMSQRLDWKTPKHIIEMLEKEFGKMFDPCPTDPTFDGLSINWGGVNYVNPPYGREIGNWCKKAFEEWKKGKTIIMLIPSRTKNNYHAHSIKNRYKMVA